MPRSNENFGQYPYHTNVVENFKLLWRKRTNRELTVTDTFIFNLWRDTYADADSGETHDELVLELLSEELDRQASAGASAGT